MNDTNLEMPLLRATIEILNRSGQMVHRQLWDGSRLQIGRALNNELVVADPYVCPHHLKLELEDGKALLRDLGSLNGSYLNNSKARLESLSLCDGMTVHFGHSQLRFHSGLGELQATLRDTSRWGVLSGLGKPWVLLVLAVLALLALYASELLQDPGSLGWLGIAEEMSYPLIGVVAWAGFWALLNRVLAHRFHFSVHLAIAFAGVACLFAVSQLISLLGFALDWDESVWWLRWLGRIFILAWVVFAHLRYFSQAQIPRQALLAGFSALLLFGTAAVGSFIEKTQFSSLPWLDPLIRPPAYQFREGVSVQDFMRRAQSLRKRAEEETGNEEVSD